MKAVITAGGKGTRVAAVNAQIPKPMIPINGKPVLQHQIECLQRQGISDITLTIGHLGEQIRNYFGDGQAFSVSIDYIQETQPLGTAGALYYLKERIQEDFFLINGDLIFDVDFHRLMAFHKAHKAAATLLVHPNDHPEDSGLIMAAANGQVENWLTKEDSRQWYQNCVNAGIHVLAPKFLNVLDEPKKLDLDRDLLRPRISLGDVYAYRSPEYIKDMGTPERISSVERDLRVGLVAQKNLRQKQRAIFLDRDGTINRYVGFLRQIDEMVLLDGAAQAIRQINQSGYLAIIVTNQPVIARGEVTWQTLRHIHNKMETLLGQAGAYIDHIYICPHHPDRGFPGEVAEYKTACNCRKPKPGLLLQAAKEYNIDLTKSWMIGDSTRDIEAGMAAGCHTMQISDAFSLTSAIAHIAQEAGWQS
jgi:D-glycero-D-manno-heptose 1,7-bisphosphate phosphatase